MRIEGIGGTTIDAGADDSSAAAAITRSYPRRHVRRPLEPQPQWNGRDAWRGDLYRRQPTPLDAAATTIGFAITVLAAGIIGWWLSCGNAVAR
jgi:hypothetical protein